MHGTSCVEDGATLHAALLCGSNAARRGAARLGQSSDFTLVDLDLVVHFSARRTAS